MTLHRRAVATFAVLFWFKLPEVSRLFLVILFPTQFVVALVTRAIMRLAFRHLRARGMNGRFVLEAGAGPRGQAFAATMESHRELGLRVIGFLDDESEYAEGARWPWLGQLADLEKVLVFAMASVVCERASRLRSAVADGLALTASHPVLQESAE